MAAGLAAAKLNVLPNAKGSAAAVVKSGCPRDRNPEGGDGLQGWLRAIGLEPDHRLGGEGSRQPQGTEANSVLAGRLAEDLETLLFCFLTCEVVHVLLFWRLKEVAAVAIVTL